MYSKNQLVQQYKKYINDNKNNFDAKNGLRILSYNVQLFKDIYQSLSFNKLNKLIDDSNSDIIILYEALFLKNYKTIFEEMIKKTKYVHIKYCNDKFGINILLSKYPITKCKILQLVKDPIKNMSRYAIIATITVGDKLIKIAGCHLDVFDESEQTRKTQIEQVLNELDDEYILFGDLNSLRKKDYDDNEWNNLIKDCKLRNTEAYTLVTDFIEKNYFIDSWNLIDKQSPKITVWSMRRVDYIYVGKNFKYSINNCNLLFTDSSDHLPLYIDIDFY